MKPPIVYEPTIPSSLVTSLAIHARTVCPDQHCAVSNSGQAVRPLG